MKLFRLVLPLMLCIALSSCFQLQILGTVIDGRFVVTPLRDPGTTLNSGESWNDDNWLAVASQEDWDSWEGFLQLLILGIFFPDNDQLSPDALYLIKASFGEDQDSNLDQLRDSNGTPINGEWYAIVTGAQIAAGGFKVSSLTDAIYRVLADELDSLSNEQVLQRLQELAERTVNDANEDGVVDYLDVLYWNRVFNAAAHFRYDLDALDDHGRALIAGFSTASLYESAQMALSGYDAAYWKQLIEEIDSGDFTRDQFLYAISPDPAQCQAGTLTEAAKMRSATALNKNRELHGLSPVAHSPTYDADTQDAALIQRANNYLDHFPSMDDACYSAIGADAASTSNMSNGSRSQDPAETIIGWTDDSFNLGALEAAGHRRWNLDPFMAYTSYGQVVSGAVLKVLGFDREPDRTPPISVDYVAFPYRTYPYIFLSDDPARPTPWSFSVVENKSSVWANQHPYFNNATIRVTRVADGSVLSVYSQYSDTNGTGIPNFLSWQVSDWQYDTLYRVNIDNVEMSTGAMRDYVYEVFIDYAHLVDLNEPLEQSDSVNGNSMTGTLADEDDLDSFEVTLSGNVTVNVTTPFNPWPLFVSVYGPDKQLIGKDDESFSLLLPSATYTVVVGSCGDDFCWQGERSYTVTVN